MTYTKHTVKKGESLSVIAKKYGTTVAAIQSANKDKITNVNVIRVGWTLYIPVSEPSEKDYKAIGKQLETALRDIQNLSSVKSLLSKLKG